MRDELQRFLHSHECRLLAVLAVMIAALTIFTSEFATLQNLLDVTGATAFIGIMAAGLLVVIITGGIDLSFAAAASITQYGALTLANHVGLGWPGVFAVAIGLGILLGAINGLLVNVLRTSALIITIATLNVFYGVLLTVTGGADIFMLPDWFNAGIEIVFYTDAQGNPYALNLQIMALVLAFMLTWLLLNRSNTGRQIYAMGGNPDAAQRVGFNVFRLNILVYAYMGALAGLASLVQAQLAQSVSPTALVGRELDVVAAVVIGGASLMGGKGTVLGTVLGVALIAIMQNGLILLGISSYWSLFSTGLVIIAAMIMMARETRKQNKLVEEGAVT
ncbi:ABC transporter permease [Pantoea sp. Mb-10]|uniref:ABC transporter permease n=1 Tax=unclassified Pantoea TaxID=2630326 RepID=UPI001E2C367A|nr:MULTISPECIES: ABC transporter permease [unclassified Pantoea]MCE0490818.1 ABC transporter permease [Pantoea sp. Mb-10]MCE0500024.1 ABC transporter permease [Pantoea sp. Pb-8]